MSSGQSGPNVSVGRHDVGVRFDELVATSAAVAATSGRKDKVSLVAAALRRLSPAEATAGVSYLTGELRQRQIGVGWAALRDLEQAPPGQQTLTVGEVDEVLAEIGTRSGPGSQTVRRDLLAGLFGRATAEEADFLRRLLVGELRQGAQAGVMVDAIALAAEVPVTDVRRALLLGGDLKEVAAAALSGGQEALGQFRLQVGRPLAPMLAGAADSVLDALARTGPASVETKIDGARIQVHRDGDEVGVFTRSLDDVTARVPEIVDAVPSLPVRQVVLDGEAIALRTDGRPRPFQVTASRIGSAPILRRLAPAHR